MSALVITILSQGKELDPDYHLLSLEVQRELNRIPSARLRLVDGDVAAARFAISDAAAFAPGREITIKLGHLGGRDTPVFRGIVVRHGVESTSRLSVLVVELKDATIKLCVGRKSAVFRDKSDGEVIKAILSRAGIRAGEVAPTKPTHAEIVQYRSSDWDFILSRADVQGLAVSVEDGALSVKEISVRGGHKHEFRYGIDDILELELGLDVTGHHRAIESVAWDLGELKATSPSKAKAVAVAQGETDGDELAGIVGGGTQTLAHLAPLHPDELQAWADARMTRSRLSMIRGRLTVPGLADIKPLDIVKITGFGDRYSGKALVTGVSQRVDEGMWRTEIQLGLDADWFCHRERIAEAPAAGLLPPVSGLQIGIVDEFEDDPDKEYRVKVILPSIDDEEGAVWARLSAPDAGKDRGYFFRPEPGDEVVVGFFNSDPRQPVILGAMFGSKNKPHDLVSELSRENKRKAIITGKGTTIGFLDDDKASVFIETRDRNRILFDDDKRCIEIKDQHGNAITMKEDGVVIESAGDLRIEARGKVRLEAGQDMEIDATGTLDIAAAKTDIR